MAEEVDVLDTEAEHLALPTPRAAGDMGTPPSFGMRNGDRGDLVVHATMLRSSTAGARTALSYPGHRDRA